VSERREEKGGGCRGKGRGTREGRATRKKGVAKGGTRRREKEKRGAEKGKRGGGEKRGKRGGGREDWKGGWGGDSAWGREDQVGKVALILKRPAGLTLGMGGGRGSVWNKKK